MDETLIEEFLDRKSVTFRIIWHNFFEIIWHISPLRKGESPRDRSNYIRDPNSILVLLSLFARI